VILPVSQPGRDRMVRILPDGHRTLAAGTGAPGPGWMPGPRSFGDRVVGARRSPAGSRRSPWRRWRTLLGVSLSV